MVHWKRWLFILIAAIVGIGVAMLLVSIFSSNYLVDIWWFNSLGYEFYYWQRLLYRYIVFIGVTLAFFLIFFLNFWVASRYLGTTAPPATERRTSALAAYRDVAKMFRTGSLRVYTPLSVILAIPIALPLFRKWEAFLLYVFAPGTGLQDPTFGKDISYYLFSFPIYTLLQRRLLIAFSLLLLGLLVLYLLERRLLVQQEQPIPRGAKIHLTIIILLIFLIEIWDYFLQRYELLYDTSHMPLFFGPGYVEMRILLPLIYVSMVFLLGTALSFIYFLYNRSAWKVLAIFAAGFILSLGARYSSFLPQVVDKYIVKPNEISREKPFINHNIQSTLRAYNLTNVETRDFGVTRVPEDVSAGPVRTALRNIPIWDGELLDDVYQQLQQLRTYYSFPTVDVGRYTVNDIYQQVFLAAREFDYRQIPQAAQNWVNLHLSYTHGYGLVMTPASQGGDEPMTWFIRGIPPESEYGFKVEQPSIYFGQQEYTYVIAPNDAGEIDYPKGNANVMTNYKGTGGVPLSSMFRKLLFAIYFKDRNILFTTKTNNDSKILFRQNITERIRLLTPYIILDKDPYLVTTPKGMFWIQDAYTTSDLYPYAAPYDADFGRINYIRNSVKIVIDAYNGTVDYYIFDLNDPIIRAYSRAYPGVFKSWDKVPAELVDHIRYPRDIFTMQLAMYSRYHQTDPEVFYQQEDVWEFAKTISGSDITTMLPYYVTLDLVEPNKFSFILLEALSPRNRDNLRALALVSCDKPDYGKIIVYNFPKGELIYGPSQIYALINQDTRISEQFTLWGQVGSTVARGKMIILPIGNVILYIQPVYLISATQLRIPELKRIILSEGQTVLMEKSLEEAYAKLKERVEAEVKKTEKRFAPLKTETPPEADSKPGDQPATEVQPGGTGASPTDQPPPEAKQEGAESKPTNQPPPGAQPGGSAGEKPESGGTQ